MGLSQHLENPIGQGLHQLIISPYYELIIGLIWPPSILNWLYRHLANLKVARAGQLCSLPVCPIGRYTVWPLFC
ncbi:hypothetical protein XELAEV_18046652mg [Xenopus laevis]|uniref:Uncharacterized protein n=1 Tax=Xenopus laevis TaxID=8355 RepID=A0A974BTK6_XENLA|nr:hypothetical protein XELAEV_18046652mg [Xenopus laevis]